MRSAIWLAAALLALTACEKQPSKLDDVAAAERPPTGDLEGRVAKLESQLRDRGEMLEWLDSIYERQLEEQAKPQPGVVYGVDISQNIKLGQFEGAPDALVTIVEAWDFA
jgi:hypothetical protein